MTYHYTECGLDYVYLKNGYKLHETPYGQGVSFKNGDVLDLAIAHALLQYPARLRGQEIRFIRALLDMTQNKFAAKLGVKRLTVARWEAKPKTPIPGPADRLIRIMYFAELFRIVDGVKGDEIPKYAAHSIIAMFDLMPEIGSLDYGRIEMVYVPDLKSDELPIFENNEEPGWRAAA